MRRMHQTARLALGEGWPILVTAVVVGLGFGVTAREADLAPLEAAGSSVLIFAGAAQFAAVDLLARGAPAPLVVLTVLLVNLRHLLMGAALRPIVATRPIAVRLGAAYLLTDESFALAVAWSRRGVDALRPYLLFGASLWACWNLGTIGGATLGAAIGDPRTYGLDFAIGAVFVAIVTLGARDRADVAVALFAGAAAGALRLAGASAVAVVVAGALAPLVAFAFAREPRVRA